MSLDAGYWQGFDLKVGCIPSSTPAEVASMPQLKLEPSAAAWPSTSSPAHWRSDWLRQKNHHDLNTKIPFQDCIFLPFLKSQTPHLRGIENDHNQTYSQRWDVPLPSVFSYETRDPLEFVDIKRGESEGSPRKKRLRLKGSLIAI